MSVNKGPLKAGADAQLQNHPRVSLDDDPLAQKGKQPLNPRYEPQAPPPYLLERPDSPVGVAGPAQAYTDIIGLNRVHVRRTHYIIVLLLGNSTSSARPGRYSRM